MPHLDSKTGAIRLRSAGPVPKPADLFLGERTLPSPLSPLRPDLTLPPWEGLAEPPGVLRQGLENVKEAGDLAPASLENSSLPGLAPLTDTRTGRERG